MTRLIQAIPVLVLLAVAVSSISVGTVVFADDDCEDECISNQGHSIYANSLSFDFAQPQMYDSCDVKQAPCIVFDPLDMSNEVFIADSALDSTKTLITLSALEQDNFPTQIDDIFEFRFEVSNFIAHRTGGIDHE